MAEGRVAKLLNISEVVCECPVYECWASLPRVFSPCAQPYCLALPCAFGHCRLHSVCVSPPCLLATGAGYALLPRLRAAGLADREMVGFAQEPSAPPSCRTDSVADGALPSRLRAAGLADREMVGFAQDPSAPPSCRTDSAADGALPSRLQAAEPSACLPSRIRTVPLRKLLKISALTGGLCSAQDKD